MFLSDEGSAPETLDFTIGSTPTLYSDLFRYIGYRVYSRPNFVPQTIDYVRIAYSKYYFMIKRLGNNCIDCFQVNLE